MAKSDLNSQFSNAILVIYTNKNKINGKLEVVTVGLNFFEAMLASGNKLS